MVASGTFGFGEEYSELIDLNKLGAVVTKSITSSFSISGGVRNLLDYTAPVFQPEQPGSVFFVQTSFSY